MIKLCHNYLKWFKHINSTRRTIRLGIKSSYDFVNK